MVSLRMRWPNTGDKIQGKVVLSNVQITIVVLMINVSGCTDSPMLFGECSLLFYNLF